MDHVSGPPYIVSHLRTMPEGGLPHGEHPHDYGYPVLLSRVAVRSLEERSVFNAGEWRDAGGDQADGNGRFWHPALILRQYAYARNHSLEGEIVADVFWLHTGQKTHGHFVDMMRAVQNRAIPEDGGSVSLPDGTRVEVRATTWLALVHDLTLLSEPIPWSVAGMAHAVILTAWNAEHGR